MEPLVEATGLSIHGETGQESVYGLRSTTSFVASVMGSYGRGSFDVGSNGSLKLGASASCQHSTA